MSFFNRGNNPRSEGALTAPTAPAGYIMISYLNNSGGGLASWQQVAEGTTLTQFCASRQLDVEDDSALIRVNRQQATADQVLRQGDRVSVTPRKIEGA